VLQCPEPPHRTRVVGSLRAALALVVTVAFAACAPTDPGSQPPDGTPPEAVTTAPVLRQDLTTVDRLDGRLSHGDTVPLAAGREGVVTWLPQPGSLIRRGEMTVEVNGVASLLLYGDRPAWRRLTVDVLAGPDIRQLNDNLTAMGYSEPGDLPDDQFDWRTREAVRDWQEDLGLKRTGVVELGDVMFRPSEFRVETLDAEPGMWVGVGQTLFHGSGTDQVVTVDMDPSDLGDVSRGFGVTVVMPDRAEVVGVVRSIGGVVSTPEADGEPVVTVVIDIDSTRDSNSASSETVQRFDSAPVTVLFERLLAEDVLVVPVGALLASAEGGYAVELVTVDTVNLVAVDPGSFADGLVEITGEVVEGDEVVVPS
jgi:peptidoglycan hydrolase-like protein with peptidoglycan-binding domain